MTLEISLRAFSDRSSNFLHAGITRVAAIHIRNRPDTVGDGEKATQNDQAHCHDAVPSSFLYRFVPSVGMWSHLTESGMDRPKPPDSGPVSAKITLEWQMRLCAETSRHAASFEAFHLENQILEDLVVQMILLNLVILENLVILAFLVFLAFPEFPVTPDHHLNLENQILEDLEVQKNLGIL